MPRILIAGGGIAGLSLIRALRDPDWEIDLVERSSSFDSRGIGIVIHPNGMSVLSYLGLDGEVRNHGVALHYMEIFRGETKLTLPLQEIWGDPMLPSVAILRSRLHEILARAAISENQKAVRIRMGRYVTGIQSTNSMPVVQFDDGTRGRYDLVVGADGVHSTIRRALQVDTRAVSTKLFYFRLPARNVIGLATDTWLTIERVDSAYGFIPVSKNEVHCFVQLRADKSPCASGNELEYFRDMLAPWDQRLHESFEARCGQLYTGFAHIVRPICWGEGMCVLLGDASHAISPTLSEGGSLAMEDALVLALCLRHTSSVRESLELYKSIRHDRVVWANRMALSQVNSPGRTRRGGRINSALAMRHLRHMYAPLQKNAIPETLLPTLNSTSSMGGYTHG